MSVLPWAVWLLPMAGAFFVPPAERARRGWGRWLAIGTAAATAILSADLAASFTSSYVATLGGWSVYRGVEASVYVDGLSVLLALFVSSLSLVILVYASGNMRREAGQGRFYFLMLVFIGAMMGLVMAGNLIQFYLLWEVLGICSALLIAFWWERPAARRAGMKAFVVTRVGDVALLIAVVMVLAQLHTTDISTVVAAASRGGVNWDLIGGLFLVGAMGKSAQVPLHVWLPDAMEGPTPVSALIHAATMVNAGVYLLVRLSPVYIASPALSDAVLAVGIASILVGGACASASNDIKRVLAYSTISQLGFMFAAVGVGTAAGAVYLLIGQGVFKALAFMSAGSVTEAVGTRDLGKMGGLAGGMKITYAGFLLSSLALAGFPPLFGFWTKGYVESFALASGTWVLLALLAGSALTTFYMFRALFRAFHGSRTGPAVTESGGLMTGPIVVLSAASVVGWIGVSFQSMYLPALGTGVDLLIAGASTGVVILVLVVSLRLFGASQGAASLMRPGGLWVKLAAVLDGGLWFDAAYSAVVSRGYEPLAKGASRLQTGELGKNVALLLALALAVVALVAVVVG